jgi:hypothetical protein
MNIRFYVDPETDLPHIYGHQVDEGEVEDVLRHPGEKDMKQRKFPPGWDEARVRRVLSHYEEQSEEEAVAEDEAAMEDKTQTVMEIPNDLVPAVRELIAKRRAS